MFAKHWLQRLMSMPFSNLSIAGNAPAHGASLRLLIRSSTIKASKENTVPIQSLPTSFSMKRAGPNAMRKASAPRMASR
ncbi:hypothetical protein D9M69_540430 [compost metagenome]